MRNFANFGWALGALIEELMDESRGHGGRGQKTRAKVIASLLGHADTVVAERYTRVAGTVTAALLGDVA